MLFVPFALFSLVASTGVIFIPKFKPNTPAIRPPSPPKVDYKPNTNKPAPQVPAKPAPAQEQVQANNVGGLNNKLKKAEDIAGLIDIGKDIAQAILGTTQSTTVKASSTATINATAFAPCNSYASILASCASATTSFYDLDYEQQASCACYQSSTNTAACQAVPTLDTSYDDYEYECYDFFDSNGYVMIAQAMNDSLQLPGPMLCNWAPAEFSMPSTLPAKTVSCAAASPTSTASASAQETGNNGAAQLLTTFDQGVFVISAVTVAAFSWVLFD
ncbi:hypothetical protein C7974DRAFT_25505 [Boeremia exigua]|uniref:uncharacterized protein n=1 Tax=Boeremia exigua TaxID=749465 RepID=UPI001E8CF57F|nr:uncharacterized protein C7974DRAFT_25505 [Boeremia exigua]KAH6644653.1 hypothetical protein C7974DRAFT_25505 [Boeremia exigua]